MDKCRAREVLRGLAQETARLGSTSVKGTNVSSFPPSSATKKASTLTANVARSKSLDDREAQLAARIAEHESDTVARNEIKTPEHPPDGFLVFDSASQYPPRFPSHSNRVTFESDY